MADTLSIRDLVAQCRLGVPDREREQPQPVWIDLDVAIDARRAAKTEDMAHALDYAALVSAVRRVAEARPYRLLEALAEDLAAWIRGEFSAGWVKVRVKKRALPGIDYAAVEIERPAAADRAGVRRARRAARGRPPPTARSPRAALR